MAAHDVRSDTRDPGIGPNQPALTDRTAGVPLDRLSLPRTSTTSRVRVRDRVYHLARVRGANPRHRRRRSGSSEPTICKRSTRHATRGAATCGRLPTRGSYSCARLKSTASRCAVVALTRRGKDSSNRIGRPVSERPQAFHAGLVKPREIAHDSQLYRLFQAEAGRIEAEGGRVERVVLDYELKRDYQTFLNRPRPARGRRSRGRHASVRRGAWLPVVDGHLELPDLRIEFDDAGRPARVPRRRARHGALLARPARRQERRRLRALPRGRRRPGAGDQRPTRRHAVRSASSWSGCDDLRGTRHRASPRSASRRGKTRFLAMAALHSGYCLRRQYPAFAGIRTARTCATFSNRSCVRGLARALRDSRQPRAHLSPARADRSIARSAQDDNRNRRQASPRVIARKLMLLDYVLTSARRGVVRHRRGQGRPVRAVVSAFRSAPLPQHVYSAAKPGGARRRRFLSPQTADRGRRRTTHCAVRLPGDRAVRKGV